MKTFMVWSNSSHATATIFAETEKAAGVDFLRRHPEVTTGKVFVKEDGGSSMFSSEIDFAVENLRPQADAVREQDIQKLLQLNVAFVQEELAREDPVYVKMTYNRLMRLVRDHGKVISLMATVRAIVIDKAVKNLSPMANVAAFNRATNMRTEEIKCDYMLLLDRLPNPSALEHEF